MGDRLSVSFQESQLSSFRDAPLGAGPELSTHPSWTTTSGLATLPRPGKTARRRGLVVARLGHARKTRRRCGNRRQQRQSGDEG